MPNPPEFGIGMLGLQVRFTAENLKPEAVIGWLEYHGDRFMELGGSEFADYAMRCYRSAWDLTRVWAGHEEARGRLEKKCAPLAADRLRPKEGKEP